ncbi:MAG TPA: TonB-dependent receptor [Opitutaceae bacterium]|jgi:outer membrane receptor protein involved in Fe transport|nr:TonB-dependent receptor [Opitutaceae bacterium]
MDGYRMPQSAPFCETLCDGTLPPTETIQQWEAGLKYATSKLSVFAALVQTEQQNQLFTGVLGQPDGTLVTQNFLRDSQA